MALPATDLASPVPARTPRRWLAAIGWALAVAGVTAGLWAGGLIAGLSLLKVTPHVEYLCLALIEPLILAIIGGIAGLVMSVLVGFLDGRSRPGVSFGLCSLGAFAGAVGGGLSLPIMLLCARWLHPLVSSSLLWAVIGLFAGLFGYRSSHRSVKESPGAPPARRSGLLTAAEWGFAAAICAGGSWAAALLAVRAIFGITFPTGTPGADLAFILGGTGAILGFLAGTGLAFRCRSGKRGAAVLMLGIGGTLFGALTGVAGILTAPVTGDRLPSLVSSSLGVAIVGFFAGLCGSIAARLLTSHAEPEEEEEDARPAAKVEWLLHESKRRWRVNRPLLRLFPILLATSWALACAVFFFPWAMLMMLAFAFAPLGIAVAFVLYQQEKRLDALERRLRERD